MSIKPGIKPISHSVQPATALAGKVALSTLVALLVGLALLLRFATGLQELLLDAPVSQALSPESIQTQDASIDLAAIKALQLFSDHAAVVSSANAPAELPLNAPATVLNLQLEGVMLSSQSEQSVAVIVSQAQQRSYRQGDSLPGASGLSLQAVAKDHVLINNRGRVETLWLDKNKQARVAAAATSDAQSSSGSLADKSINSLNAMRSSNPAVAAATLAEIMEVSPAQANGQLIGYRINPGVKLKEFVQLGFRAGDVITQINGLALNDMSKLPQLYSLMNEATAVSFSLLRDGQPLSLNINLQPPANTASN